MGIIIGLNLANSAFLIYAGMGILSQNLSWQIGVCMIVISMTIGVRLAAVEDDTLDNCKARNRIALLLVSIFCVCALALVVSLGGEKEYDVLGVVGCGLMYFFMRLVKKILE